MKPKQLATVLDRLETIRRESAKKISLADLNVLAAGDAVFRASGTALRRLPATTSAAGTSS
jgi:catalase (peroxidase I)